MSAALLCIALGGCGGSRAETSLPHSPEAAGTSASEPGSIDLADVTAETGIAFRHTHGGSGHQYIVEAISAGLATFDYDGDGLIDIYLVNGAPLRGTKLDYTPRSALYRNLGGWRFADVTDEAGVGHVGQGMGATAADYDNDGDTDLFVTAFGSDVLYRNNGDGTFDDISDEAGVADGQKVGAGACFLDIEGDGDLDLYSANYCKFSYDTHPQRVIGGVLRAPSPLDFEPEPDSLFANNGDGTFRDVSESAGIRQQSGRGMGLVAGDFDNDRDTDIFICNDVMANFLLRNDGRGQFVNVAPESGVAYGFWGKANGNMGVDCADYDHDGWFDLVITTYQAEMPVLQRNLGQGLFEDVAIKSGFGAETMPHVKWGVGFADFDNDGDRDIFVANGHIEEKIHLVDKTTHFRVPNALYLNERHGSFRDVSASVGTGLAAAQSSRGTALDDLDNDGNTDIVVLNAQDKPTVIRNNFRGDGHWIQLMLRGIFSNRDALGARIKVVTGQLSQVEEVRSGRGYQSHYGSRVHLGLGTATSMDRIEILWPSGQTSTFENTPADQRLLVVEGASAPVILQN